MNKQLLRETQLAYGLHYALVYDSADWWATPSEGVAYARPTLTFEESALPTDPAQRAAAFVQLQLELAVATLALRI